MSEKVEVSVMVSQRMVDDFDEEVEKSVVHESRAAAIREAMGEWMSERYDERTNG